MSIEGIFLKRAMFYLHPGSMKVKGEGGPRSIFTFLLFLIQENVRYQEFFRDEKMWFPAKVIAISRKSTLKFIFSNSFWDFNLKLGSYLLGTDLADFWFRSQKWKYWILKIPNLHFWSILANKQPPKFDIFTSEV